MSELYSRLPVLSSKQLVHFTSPHCTLCTIQKERGFIELSYMDACREFCNQDIVPKARRIVFELVIGQADVGSSDRESHGHIATVLLHCVGIADRKTCCCVEKKSSWSIARMWSDKNGSSLSLRCLTSKKERGLMPDDRLGAMVASKRSIQRFEQKVCMC